MPAYKAPVEDVLFLLNDVFHIERHNNVAGFGDATPDAVSYTHLTLPTILLV